MERTLSLIKPDAVAKGAIGAILKMIEDKDLRICAMRMLKMSRSQAEGFYAVHQDRPFFNDLCNFMSSGPIVASVLAGENAIARYRDLMGATDSTKATAGTIRAAFGTDIEKNAVHGSDAAQTAATEIAYMFSACELSDLK